MGQNGSGGTSPRSISNAGPRCIALVGPFQSGKTTLLEAILARTGAVQRQGTADAGTTVGDASKEARHHKMSVEATFATTSFMGDSYTFIDCPGSVEFIQDMRSVLPAVDAAVVVCEADEKKVPQLQLILRELEDQNIPRFLFLNKIDKADKRVRETVQLLQPASRVPLLLRQIPIWKGDLIAGFVDLALERAFVYKEYAPSEVVDLAGEDLSREKEARFTMLETLADHDDELMEQLLEDIQPPRDKVFDDLAKELRDRIVCPVLLGCATRSNGVLRLLKALRHEAPGVGETAERLGVKANGDLLLSNQARFIGWYSELDEQQLGALFASTKTLTTKRETITKFIRAYRRGVADYNKMLRLNQGKRQSTPQTREVATIIARYAYPGMPPARATPTVENAAYYIDPQARLDPADVARQIEWFKAQGFVDANVDPKVVVDTSFSN